jgi:soluble lytic murein transglycosylase-like protein
MTIESTAARLASAGVAYAPEIARAARRHGVDPCLLAAVAAQETGGPGSNGGRNVVGDGGHGRGLFQIDDRWHAFARSAAAMDPADNADYAAGMLHGLLAKYGNVAEALSAYNAGDPHATGTPTDWGDEQLGYADSVMRHYSAIAGAGPDAVAQLALGSIQAAPPQSFPPPSLGPPASPAAQPASYHRQATDYSGLFDPDDSSDA